MIAHWGPHIGRDTYQSMSLNEIHWLKLHYLLVSKKTCKLLTFLCVEYGE